MSQDSVYETVRPGLPGSDGFYQQRKQSADYISSLIFPLPGSGVGAEWISLLTTQKRSASRDSADEMVVPSPPLQRTDNGP